MNYINGQPVNVKYRSCDATASGYTKCWSQDSPTTPCPPYNIDCINPLLIAEENIPRLIVTEGERDVLTLREAGYPYVISVPNGAASDLSKGFEAFRPWLDRVQELVICGDSDLPGRTLVKHLADYFGTRCLFTVLPGGCKDISDVLVAYGVDVVREIIGSACPHRTSDIITVSERADEIMNVLNGNYDHGYDVGYGPLTDRVFHPTDQGGLIIATGKPNCGKTDFLNDLTCRLMAKTGRNVCYLSFEVPDKNKHMANLIRLMLGKVNTAAYTREQLQPIVSFLDGHMVHLDLHEVSPTPANIIERAERVKRAMPLKYLIIDPYLFMEMETGRYNTETQAMKGMLEPKFKEVVLGHAEVRQVFKITGAGAVAGCYVQDGKIQRNAEVRVVRDGIVFHEGHLNTLKRFKDDVKEVATSYECGMSIENYNDIKEGDIIECFVMEEVKR